MFFNDLLVGYAIGRHEPEASTVSVTLVGVLEAYRRRGLARLLLDELASHVQRKHKAVTRFVADVGADPSPAAAALFKRAGYLPASPGSSVLTKHLV